VFWRQLHKQDSKLGTKPSAFLDKAIDHTWCEIQRMGYGSWHFNRETKVVRRGAGPAFVGSATMWAIEGASDFDRVQPRGITRQVAAVSADPLAAS
jgi:hypothetical protein